MGFYGGINYGHGYGGVGYEGGYWNEGRLYYNSAVTNVNVAVIHTTYQAPANENPVRTTVSYNGGAGGTSAKPLDKELVAARARIFPRPRPRNGISGRPPRTASCWFHSIKAVRAGIFLPSGKALPWKRRLPDKRNLPKTKSMKKNKKNTENMNIKLGKRKAK